MKKSIYLAVAIVLAAVSCQRTELVPEYNFSIKATREAAVDTKSTVSDAGSFSWVSGDAIAIYNGASFNTLTTKDNGDNATFSGTVVGTPQTCAVFPSVIANSTTSVNLPVSYEWVENQANAPMYAEYTAEGLEFKHLGGLIKVTVAGVPAEATSFVFTADKDITGVYEISKGEISSASSGAKNTVTFTFAAAESTREMSFYVPVPVGSYKMTVALKNGETELWSFAGSTSNDITRAKLLIMPKLTIVSIPGTGEGVDGYTAMIGEAGYNTLEEAIAAVKLGETIVLMKDLDRESGVLFDRDILATLDLNGHTLKVTNDTKYNHRALKITKGTLILKNGTVDARNVDENGNPVAFNKTSSENYTDGIYGTVRTEGGNAVLEGLTLYNNHCWGLSIKACEGTEISMNKCTINANVGGGVEAQGGTVKINDCQFIQTETSKFSSYISCAIAVSYSGVVEISNSNITADAFTSLYVYNSGGTINVNGGSYTGRSGKVLQVDAKTDGSPSVVNITDGTFTGAIAKTNYGLESINISGGTFSHPSALAYLAEGANVNIKLADDYNGPGFGLFSAGNGNDAVLDIDLGGYTWTLTADPLFGSTGTVSQYFHLEKGASDKTAVTFRNGNITVPDDIAGKMLIQNYCKLTLDNVTLTGNANCGYIVSNNNASCDIKNSTITAAEGKCAFDVYSFSSYDGVKVTVDNSTINGRVEFGGNNGKSNIFLTVNSGTLNGNLVVEEAYKDCASTNITIAKGVLYGSYTGWETYLEQE